MLATFPRVRARPGVPLYPGRSVLRRQRQTEQMILERRRIRAARTWAWPAMILGGHLGSVLIGIGLGVGMLTPELEAARVEATEAQITAEVSASNSDWMACQIVHVQQWMMGLPGWEELQEIPAAEQLTPEVEAYCRAPRQPHPGG